MRGEVLLLVGSDVTADARVLKGARTLCAAGFSVRILFTSKGQGSYPDSIDGIPVEHVDVRPVNLRAGRRWGLSSAVSTFRTGGGFASTQAKRVAVYRRKLHERRVAARIVEKKLRMRKLGSPHPSIVVRLWRRGRRESLKLALTADRVRLRARRRVLRYRIARTGGVGDTAFLLGTDDSLAPRDLRADWRRTLPDLADLELAFGPRIDALEPDLIHAHDYHLLPTAAEAAARARATGREVKLIYDAHEFVRGLTTLADDRRRALAAMERRQLRHADAVITVSDALADRLVADHGCARPAVVLNAPYPASPDRSASLSLREEAGVGPDVPLLVYSGNVTPARGVHTLIEAIPHLPADTHVVLVVGSRVKYLQQQLDRAAELGVAERLHLAPYVPPDEVPDYLSAATVGIHPLRHYPNAEIALPNKLFEYAQAGIPVVVSDCATQAAFVTERGIGEVFRADDPVDLAEAVQRVLLARDRYIAALSASERHALSWAGQEPTLLGVYDALLSRTPPDAAGLVPT